MVDHPLQVGWVDASYGLNAKSKHQKEALELLQWMTTAEFGQAVADDLKQVSLVKGVQSTDPLLKQMVAGLPGQPDAVPDAGRLPLRHAARQRPGRRPACRRCCSASRPPQQVASDIQKGVSQWFKP